MNGLIQKIKSKLEHRRGHNIKTEYLPTRGLYYNENIKITLYKASDKTIKYYKDNINTTDINEMLSVINNVVKSHIKIENSTFNDLKSIDLLYLFIYIVRITTEKPYLVKYEIEGVGVGEMEFNEDNFLYLEIEKLSKHFKEYNKERKQIVLHNGFHFSLPSIGLETQIVEFIKNNKDKYEYENMNFIYFMGNENNVANEYIDNAILMFQELDYETRTLIDDFIYLYEEKQRFKLLKDNILVDLKSGLHFDDLWQ